MTDDSTEVKYKYPCPLRMISGPSDNNLTIFKANKVDLIESV